MTQIGQSKACKGGNCGGCMYSPSFCVCLCHQPPQTPLTEPERQAYIAQAAELGRQVEELGKWNANLRAEIETMRGLWMSPA